MTNSFHYSFSDSVYKSNVFAGFYQFQKDEEFVDLTLAADGCLVKVHKILIALASPYLKDILKSMSSQSPAIYLNNVGEKELSYLLEYIYRGEVTVPVESVDAFIQLCKSLHIVGIQDIAPPIPRTTNILQPHLKLLQPKPLEKTYENIAARKTINKQFEANDFESNDNNCDSQTDINYECDLKMYKLHYSQGNIQSGLKNLIEVETFQNRTPLAQAQDSEKADIQTIIENNSQEQLDSSQLECLTITKTVKGMPTFVDNKDSENEHNDSNLMVLAHNDSVNNSTSQTNMRVLEIVPMINSETQNQKASFQDNFASFTNSPHLPSKNFGRIPCDNSSAEVVSDLIQSASDAKEPADAISMKDLAHMSQFSVTERGAIQMILNRFIYCCHHKSRRRRRWRCIEYRKGKCPASVDTEGDAIIARKGVHAHPYHDGKIYKKHHNNLIFQTIELAETASKEKH